MVAMRNIVLTSICCLIILRSCNNPSTSAAALQKDTIGKIEVYSKDAASLIDSNASIEIIGRHYQWSEGPVWIASKKMLLFSDVRANTVFSWNMKDTPVAYLSPSGYTDTAVRNGENGSNGLTLDRNGNLLLCQSGNRQVVRMNASLDSPKPSFTVLSSNYKGRKFNSPNDLICDSKGNIYFTDPIYGLPQHENDPSREMNFEGVFKIDNDGNIVSGKILLDATTLKEKATIKQGGDGFKIDKFGNLFAAGPDGLNIISPEGKLMALIRIYNRPVSNCAFNETKDVVYITADDLVLRVKLH